MIVIPMVGLSSRFFQAGYEKPKYQLEIGGECVFSLAVKSFEKYFKSDKFLFIIRSDYDSYEFVSRELEALGVKNYQLKVIDFNTMGQAETVYLGCEDVAGDEPLYIFNIDTFRHDFSKPDISDTCDGYLEVFRGEGDHWSFIEVDGDRVVRTTEKNRISDLCSDGLYYFRKKSDFDRIFKLYKDSECTIKGEYYIAPMYNALIEEGADIRFELINLNQIDFCGTPDEYTALQNKIY